MKMRYVNVYIFTSVFTSVVVTLKLKVLRTLVEDLQQKNKQLVALKRYVYCHVNIDSLSRFDDSNDAQ